MRLSLLILLLLAPLARAALPDDRVSVTVLEVVDGDSAQVRMNGRRQTIRLFGVDAPEGRQAFGRESARELERLIGGRTIALQIVERADRYDRPVVIAWRGENSVNGMLLSGGYVWAYRQYLDAIPDGGEYCRLEAEARDARRALWGQAAGKIAPPWQWRRQDQGEPVTFTRPGDLSLQNCLDAIPRRRNAPAPPTAGSGPESRCAIKGNINAKGNRLYHLPGSPSYAGTRIDPTRGERWFCTEGEARAAGWQPAG